MPTLEEKIRALPPELQREVEDFLDSLLSKHTSIPKKPMKLDWRGGLKELRDKYTSVQLQHKILEWRMNDVSS